MSPSTWRTSRHDVKTLWRDRLVPWWLPVVVLLGFLLPNTGVHWLIGFGAMAAVGLTLAYVLWRIPVARWHGSRAVEEPRAEVVAS